MTVTTATCGMPDVNTHEATKLTDGDLARALWCIAERVPDDVVDVSLTIVGEALERWAPDADLAVFTEMVRVDRPEHWQLEVKHHKMFCRERRVMREAAHGEGVTR